MASPFAGLAGLVLASILLASCTTRSGTPGSGGTPNSAAPKQVIQLSMQVNPGGVVSWLPYVAEEKGYFSAEGLNMRLVSAATGVTGTSALLSGSVNFANLDPLLVAPLLAKGQDFRLVGGNMLNFWQVYAKKGLSATTFPQSMTQFKGKHIAVAALGGGGFYIMKGLQSSAGLTSQEVTYDAAGSAPAISAALESGSASGAEVEAVGGCLLSSDGYPRVISFADASMINSLPSDMQDLSKIPDFSIWALGSWADQHLPAITKMQDAMIHAWEWASNPNNLGAVSQLMRNSPYNVPALNDTNWKTCVARIFDNLTGPYFSPQDGTVWSKYIVRTGIAPNMPPTSKWLLSSVPATASQAKSR